MEQFEYSAGAKLIYRYGNFIATPLLSVHMIFSFIVMFEIWYYVFFALLNFGIIFAINKYYIKTYKLFPFKIAADNEKITCSNYLFSKKTFTIEYKNIDKISGGFFSGYPTRPIYVHDGKQNITIGFYSHVGKFNKFVTKILQNIPTKLYNEVIENLKGVNRRK